MEDNKKPQEENKESQQTKDNNEQTDNKGQDNTETKVKLSCAVAYLWILFFVPLILCPDDARGKFHANQGLVLFITMLALNAVVVVINLFMPPVVKNILYTLTEFFGIALTIIGILNVCNGEMKPLPLIGKFNLIK